MRYLIDGYNFLFSLSDSRKSLLIQRQELILFLQKSFKEKKLKGTLIFDAKIKLDEESGRGYPSPLEIIYTPISVTADAYIVQEIELSKEKNQITVVTNDGGLKRHIQHAKVKTMGTQPFFAFLTREEIDPDQKRRKDSDREFNRLLKIFEDKFNSEE